MLLATFRGLCGRYFNFSHLQEYKLPFPVGLEMPEQMATASGLVQKTKTLVADIVKVQEDRICSICKQSVEKVLVGISLISSPA
jgi:hypothetical protein